MFVSPLDYITKSALVVTKPCPMVSLNVVLRSCGKENVLPYSNILKTCGLQKCDINNDAANYLVSKAIHVPIRKGRCLRMNEMREKL